MDVRLILPATLLAIAAVSASPATRATNSASPRCTVDGAACWYVFYGTGDAPKRDLMLVNVRTSADTGGVRRTQAMTVFESGDLAAIVFDLEIRCASQEVRWVGGYGLGSKGELARGLPAGPWYAQDKHPFGRAARLLCDRAVAANPSAHAMQEVMSVYRPRDVASLVRAYLFVAPAATR